MSDLIRVMVVDDHTVVRKGLCSLLTAKYGLVVVGEAADGAEAVDQARKLQPDVILMDLVMPRKTGLEAIIEIKKENPQARILVLSSFSEDAQIAAAIKAGAMGYILKDASPDELVHSIQGVHMGKFSIPADMMQIVLAESTDRPEPSSLETKLTSREIDVLRYLALGRSNQEIADALGVGTTTVRSHVSSILRKLNLENRTQAALYAIEAGLTASE
jgi:NarL family two-component system response regulator LiaR